jgi:hypothetical protein
VTLAPVPGLSGGEPHAKAFRDARGVVEVQFTRLGVDPKQVIDPRHHARSRHVAGIELGRLEELPARVRLIRRSR